MKRRLITEAEVRAAAQGARLVSMPPGAIVTPAARDAAEQLGVTLGDEGERERGRENPPLPLSPSLPLPLVALGADHGGYPLKEALKPMLAGLGWEVIDLGTGGTEAVDYPDFAAAVARAVAEGRARFGIMVDGAGIGSAMAANKVKGVRAALCYDVTTAQNAREHNDATVLTLGGTLIGARLAGEIVRTFLTTPFGGGRHQARVDKISALEGTKGTEGTGGK